MAPSTSSAYNGYCVKCRQKHDFDGEVHEVEGRRMAKGSCPGSDQPTTMKRLTSLNLS